ncbi:glycerophosphoryl diester phosphodiesterase [Trypanosoma grayi]|uniref:glycerophosphoryl diester phosphodiesterase n=1 Tax=Trypanosoma grayi TaxID=71804 RepID=UPI0004F44BDA|nr:glycerophosphoryl diester phosphodiesterase [Trypanosoma grayi]KEG10514.1 glycerophosphoryl diester phosphodiesterase [Trypanosoma grayi]
MVSRGVVAAVCLGGYIVASMVLVRVIPLRGDKKRIKEVLKKRFPYSVTRIAHRGGSLIGPENTMYTFQRAVFEYNTDMLELDVQQSKDGEIVVSHDADLSRTCVMGHHNTSVDNLMVSGDPNATLPQSRRKIPLHFKSLLRGDHYEATEAVPVDETTRVCLLSEVFDAFPKIPIHIDIKCEGADFTERVLKLIEQYGRETKTFVGSSNWRNRSHILRYFQRGHSAGGEDPQEKRKRFRIFAGPLDYVIVQVAYYLGVLPFFPLSFDVFSIPIFTKSKKEELDSYFTRFLAYFLNSPTLWEHLQRRGILVVGWVLNDPEEFEEATKWPINGIMSDDLGALNAFFDAHDVSATMNLLD